MYTILVQRFCILSLMSDLNELTYSALTLKMHTNVPFSGDGSTKAKHSTKKIKKENLHAKKNRAKKFNV